MGTQRNTTTGRIRSTTQKGTPAHDGRSIVLPGVLAGVFALFFVLLRLLFAAHGDITRFMLVGSNYANPREVPPGVHVFAPRLSYDGQFDYRLALNPFNLSPVYRGLHFDHLYRLQRIGYPLVVWIVSLGQAAVVPYAMVAVNIIALAVLATLGGIAAKQAGHAPLWGLLLPAYFGFVFSLGRDLSEIFAVTLMVGALLALRSRHFAVAGACFALAVLTRETTVFVVVAVGVSWLLSVVSRRERRPIRGALPWVLPAVSYLGWEAVVFSARGRLPGTSDTSKNLGVPFAAMARAVVHYVAALPSVAADVWVGEYVVFAAVLVFAFLAMIVHTVAPLQERLAWVLVLALTVSLTPTIWLGQSDLHSLAELYALSILLILGAPRAWLLRVPAILVAGAWMVTVLHRIAFL